MAEPAAPRSQGQLRELFRLDASFWIAQLVFAFDGAAYFGIMNLLTVFLGGTVGMSDERAGLAVSLYAGLVTFSNFFLGGLADRWGARRSLAVGAFVSVVGRVLLALAPSAPFPQATAWAALVLMGLAQGVLIPAAYTAVKQSTDQRTSAVGFSLLYSLQNGGAFAASMASAPVRERWGITASLWMCAAVTAVYLIAHLIWFPRDRGRPVVVEKDAKKTSWRDSALLNPKFLYFIFVLMGVRTLFAHQWLTLPDYIMRAYPPHIGARLEWFESINGPVVMVLTPLVAAFTRRFHVVGMMLVGTAISALSGLLLVPGPDVVALVSYLVLFAVGESLWSSRFYEYVADAAPPDKIGLYMGISQVPWFLAKVTTGIYSGRMLSILFCPANGARDTSTLWLVYTLIGLSSPIGLFFARKWLKRGGLTSQSA